MKISECFVTAVFMLAATGCGKEAGIAPAASGEFELAVNVPFGMTKVEGTADENAVNDLQVFVFDHNGMLEAYAHEDRNSVSLSCSSGNKEVVALVNERPLEDVVSLTDLKGRTSFLSDNSIGSMVMEGKETIQMRASTSMSLPVSRLASRITISGISVDFELDQHDSQPFQIKSIYLLNVAGDRTYLTPTKPGLWHNKVFRESGTPPVAEINLTDVYVDAGTPYNVVHHLYCYPNPTSSDESGGVWTPRKTRLVVEAELGGKKYYYPVTLKDLQSNTAYTVKMKITRPGSSQPDKPVDSQTASFTVSVAPWEDGTVLNETI